VELDSLPTNDYIISRDSSQRKFAMNRTYYLRAPRAVVFNPANGEFSLASRGCPTICLVSKRDVAAGTIKYGFSILHPDEEVKNYSKAEGARQATSRLNGEDKDFPPLEVEATGTTGHEINKCIIEHFSKTIGKKNGQAWKLSRLWLKVSAAKANSKKVADAPKVEARQDEAAAEAAT
jgi:hypothetical protein